MTNLLILTSDDAEAEGFQDVVDEVTQASLAEASITTGDVPRVTVDGVSVEEYDAVYINPEPKAAIYARVFLEAIQEKDVRCTLDPSGFLIMTKKHYLFKVLAERNVDIPTTMAVSTEKGITGIGEELEFPVLAKMYDGFELSRLERVDEADDLSVIAERAAHGENVVVFQETEDAELYDAVYIDGDVISLKIEADPWDANGDISMNYHSLPSDHEQVVVDAAEGIGADLCRVRLLGDKVLDVSSDPKLHEVEELSGKNVFGKVADVLAGEDDE